MPRAPKYIPVPAAVRAPSPPNLFAGTSGWAYTTWKPGFYPPDVPPRAFLHFYAAQMTAVEVNFTFRALPDAATIQSWLDATPPGFRFSFKAPQQITHFKRLKGCGESVSDFMAAIRPAQRANKLGPLLFQLPPNFVANPALLRDLLRTPCLRRKPAPQVAVEFRHPSWFSEETYAVLRKYGAALCIAESDDLVTPEVFTAPFRYYRLRCNGGYPAKQIRTFAERFTEMAKTAEVFAFLKHEDEPTGALQARELVRCAAKLDDGSGETCQ